jgi:hypothetical protein
MWNNQSDRFYDGHVEFSTPLTARDAAASLVHRYTIKNGTIMSLAANNKKLTSAGKSFEEVSTTVASDVDELMVEVHLPESYDVKAKAFIERNGVEIDQNQVHGKLLLQHDKLNNVWKLQMSDPPAQHGISIRWDLPDDWVEADS